MISFSIDIILYQLIDRVCVFSIDFKCLWKVIMYFIIFHTPSIITIILFLILCYNKWFKSIMFLELTFFTFKTFIDLLVIWPNFVLGDIKKPIYVREEDCNEVINYIQTPYCRDPNVAESLYQGQPFRKVY